MYAYKYRITEIKIVKEEKKSLKNNFFFFFTNPVKDGFRNINPPPLVMTAFAMPPLQYLLTLCLAATVIHYW